MKEETLIRKFCIIQKLINKKKFKKFYILTKTLFRILIYWMIMVIQLYIMLA